MKDRPSILAVDRNRRNRELLAEALAREGYQTRTAGSLEEFDRALADPDGTGVGLVLLDISGFDRRIWERCEVLRNEGVPFLVISPRQSAALQQESLEYGASGMLVKPLAVGQLLGIVRSLLEK